MFEREFYYEKYCEFYGGMRSDQHRLRTFYEYYNDDWMNIVRHQIHSIYQKEFKNLLNRELKLKRILND